MSTDVEADSPIPAPFSMLSLGSAAYDKTGVLFSAFAAQHARVSRRKVDDLVDALGIDLGSVVRSSDGQTQVVISEGIVGPEVTGRSTADEE